ncbi:SigE family RNA polymerase sigma factor [Nocardioides marmoribigeumensis]
MTAVSAPLSPSGGGPAGWTADEAVERLHAEHYRSLVRLAVLLVRDLGTAEEVVQDSFVALHSRWPHLREPGQALPYLRRSVVNGARSVLRHRGVRERHLESLRSSYDEGREPGADEAAVLAERRRAVLAALQALPERQREVVVLRYWADLDEASIAAALGITRGAVKSHAHRAVRRLRDLLPPDAPDLEESR